MQPGYRCHGAGRVGVDQRVGSVDEGDADDGREERDDPMRTSWVVLRILSEETGRSE